MQTLSVFRKVILITGCSSGLGKAIAEKMIRSDRYRVVVTARAPSFEKLASIFPENDNTMLLPLDVTQDGEISAVVNEICRRWERIDVLINNAGVCFRSVVEHMDVSAEDLQMRTNFFGPVNLMKSVLPIMREQRKGHIVNVSSVSGMVSMPTMASYSASKHALEGVSEALWYECRPYGIHVSIVQPGFINSASFKNVILSPKARLSYELRGPHSEYYDSMAPFIEKLMGYSFSRPEAVANRIIRLIEKSNPPLRTKVTLDAIIFGVLRRMIPGSWFHKLMFYFLPESKRWGK
ncbi:SDR family oxidoreductase [Bdellovibrio sp. KM01]|uniref:SDR family oxidoreductase n=1 Tax=Bdellovibrio sp. KM01 TaxID=2748865 RepID=UPI0015E9B343|nr:SDR family oxidoreductase [Bdellovibrio sp. KM01]QLY26003.1 SDR family oxidoreductase [Bdellovibrio sp. KM01]